MFRKWRALAITSLYLLVSNLPIEITLNSADVEYDEVIDLWVPHILIMVLYHMFFYIIHD